ncbi:MAG: pyridoxal-phosphate dependent enzyme [Chloroflexi bacterium]|nr:MAG: pyridoxal-phosphate dependent enzyme [Chloroflexota bacterium]
MRATGLDLEAIRAARSAITGAAIRTPLVRLNLWDAPADIYLKLENLQPIGSFKIRGAANAMSRMSKAELAKGVLVASAGNMAQGAAFNARRLGIPCTVIAPDYAPDAKVHAIERLGGRVIKVPFDRWWQTFTDRSYPGIDAAFIHSFDDDRVMAGNGTIGLELIEDSPDVQTVLIPWGGGGLAGGIATALRALKPSLKIYAVEAETGAPLTASLKAGSPQVVDYQPSFVDGIGSKTVFPEMFAMAQDSKLAKILDPH